MADIPISYYKAVVRSQKFNPVNPPSLEEPPPVLNPPGSAPGTLYKLLGDVTDKDFIGKNGFVPVVNGEEVLTLEPLPQVQENGLISGGIVQWTGIGYIFNVSGAFYRIGGVYYESPPIQITLATPDVTNGRIDVFAVSTSSVALAITGTPSATPVKPQIDPQTQLELTSVIVGASTTTPTLTTEVIYDQNIEWVGSSSGTGTVAFNSAVNPYQGTLSIEATNIENGLKIRLTRGSDYDLSTVQTLGMQIDLKAAMFAGQNIGVTFLNSAGSAISTELILNLDKSLTSYQFIGIALSQFAFTSFLARSIEFRYIKTKGATIHAGFYLDIIKLEGGINPPQTVGYHNQLQGLQGGNATERYHLTNAELLKLQGFSPYSLAQVGASNGQTLTWVAANSRYEPVTPSGGGGITGSGTSNEIAYFTGASAIASLPVATYPSLTELSYVKGVTSGIQAQINGKQATIVGTLTDTYVATVVAGVPTWAAPSGGGSFISYATAQGLTNTQKQQARDNAGLDTGIPQLVTTIGTINDLAKTSNFIKFTGAGAVGLTGIVADSDGSELTIQNETGNLLTFSANDILSAGANRFDFGFSLANGEIITIRYNGTDSIWSLKYEAWDYVGSGIYRNSQVAIGRSTLGSGNVALAINSLGSGVGNFAIACYDVTGATLGFSASKEGWIGSAIIPTTNFESTRNTSGGGASIISRQSNAAGTAAINLINSAGKIATFGITSPSYAASLGNLLLFGCATTGTDVVIAPNLNSTGSTTEKIWMRCGGFSATFDTAYFDINGLGFSNAKNIIFGTTTGTKIGTATTQKIAFWNKTPIIQPTNAITGATKVLGVGVTVTDTDTFGGYTIGQIAAALINTGILA